MPSPNVLDDLEWRGLIAHSTDRDALRTALGEGSQASIWATWSSWSPHAVFSWLGTRPTSWWAGQRA